MQTITKTNKKMLAKGKRAITMLDFIIYVIIIGSILAALFFILKPKAETVTQANVIKTEYNTLMSGLKGYFSDNNVYPPSGWSWNTNNAYVNQDLINRGWNYQCSNDTIKITTPHIKNPKVLVKIYNTVNHSLKGTGATVSKNGDQLVIQIPDSPCQTNNQ